MATAVIDRDGHGDEPSTTETSTATDTVTNTDGDGDGEEAPSEEPAESAELAPTPRDYGGS